MNAPACKGCTKREIGCHTSCAEYVAYKVERLKDKAERSKESRMDGYTRDQKIAYGGRKHRSYTSWKASGGRK